MTTPSTPVPRNTPQPPAYEAAGSTVVQQRLFRRGYRDPEPLTLLSMGYGQDSTALLYMLHYDEALRRRYAPGRLIVMGSATSDEHDETDEHEQYVSDFCAAHAIDYFHVTPEQGHHTATWRSLSHFYTSGRRIGSKSFPKTCSWNLKLAPFYKRLESLLSDDYGVAHGRKRGLYEYTALAGKIDVLIGFSADELEKRVDEDESVPKWLRANIRRLYPLADLGMNRADCQRYIRSSGHPVPYPSLCKYCPYKSKLDVYYMARFNYPDYRRWVSMERAKLDAHRERFPDLPPEKNHGVFGPNTTLPEVLADATHRYAHLIDAELHGRRMNHGHDVRSKY